MFARKSVVGVLARPRRAWARSLEHVELRVERVARVHVVVVAAGPEEGLATGDVLDVGRVDPVRARTASPRRRSRRRPADHVHVVEEARGEREVGGGAAEHPVALAERRLDGVEGDGSNDGKAHTRRTVSVSGLGRSVRSTAWMTAPPARRPRCGQPGRRRQDRRPRGPRPIGPPLRPRPRGAARRRADRRSCDRRSRERIGPRPRPAGDATRLVRVARAGVRGDRRPPEDRPPAGLRAIERPGAGSRVLRPTAGTGGRASRCVAPVRARALPAGAAGRRAPRASGASGPRHAERGARSDGAARTTRRDRGDRRRLGASVREGGSSVCAGDRPVRR